MKRIKTLSKMFFLTILCQGNYAQQKETSDLSAITLDDSMEVQKKIRLEKFDKILPRVMRDNNIDMWVHIIRPWTFDPLRFELGASEGVFIFTDLGLNGIERAAFSANVQDPMAYDIVIEEGMERESKPGTPIEMDFRFVELRKFVSERNPKHIGVNYMDDLSVASSSEGEPLTDGISYKDYTLLIEALGENYGARVRSAEYVIMDYLAGRVQEEIKLYEQYGVIAAKNLDREFGKVVPGKTKLSDLEGNVFLRVPDGREIHSGDADPYVLKGGDLFTILHGAGTNIFHADLGGNAYLLKEEETELPPEIQEIWEHAMVVRKILQTNIKAGRTAGKTLELLVRKIEEAGYYYNPVDYYDKNADPLKTQIHLDCHAIGRSGLIGPRISPFGPDWVRNMKIPLLHTFTFEYMVHMPVPKWGKGKHLYIAFHDGAVVTKEGVVFPYTPDQEIRIIR
jgi:methionine aminopeptidase